MRRHRNFGHKSTQVSGTLKLQPTLVIRHHIRSIRQAKAMTFNSLVQTYTPARQGIDFFRVGARRIIDMNVNTNFMPRPLIGIVQQVAEQLQYIFPIQRRNDIFLDIDTHLYILTGMHHIQGLNQDRQVFDKRKQGEISVEGHWQLGIHRHRAVR